MRYPWRHIFQRIKCHYNAFLGRLEAEASEEITIYTILVYHWLASILFDLGFAYFYVSAYLDLHMDMICDSLVVHVYVSTSMCDFIIYWSILSILCCDSTWVCYIVVADKFECSEFLRNFGYELIDSLSCSFDLPCPSDYYISRLVCKGII